MVLTVLNIQLNHAKSFYVSNVGDGIKTISAWALNNGRMCLRPFTPVRARGIDPKLIKDRP